MRSVTLSTLGTVVLLLALVFACGSGEGGKKSAAPETAAQEPSGAALAAAPDFTLDRIEGGQLKLSDLRGKVVIIDFWATWCPPCVQEIPDFIELYKTYKDKGFEMVGISVDRGGVSVVNDFVAKNKVNYPVVMGSMDVVNAYQVFTGIPTTFIVNRQGQIVDKVIGSQSKEYFENYIKKLL
jgi:peroxiredoxin